MAWLPSSGPEKLLAMWTKSDMKYWRRSKRATIWGYFMGKEWHEIQSRNLCNVNVRLLIFILLYDGLDEQIHKIPPLYQSMVHQIQWVARVQILYLYMPTTYLCCGLAMLCIQTTARLDYWDPNYWLILHNTSMDKKISKNS